MSAITTMLVAAASGHEMRGEILASKQSVSRPPWKKMIEMERFRNSDRNGVVHDWSIQGEGGVVPGKIIGATGLREIIWVKLE